MGLTPRHQLPFPEGRDKPDIPSDLYELANRLDAVLTAVQLEAEQRIAELEQRIAELEAVRA
jgi:hypothetical protein